MPTESFDSLLHEPVKEATQSNDELLPDSPETVANTRLFGGSRLFKAALAGIAILPYAAIPYAVYHHKDNEERFAYAYESIFGASELDKRASAVASELGGFAIYVDCNDKKLDDAGRFNDNGREFLVAGQVTTMLIGKKDQLSLPVMTLRENLCEDITNFEPLPENEVPSNYDEYVDYIDAARAYAYAIAVTMHENEHIHQEFNEAAASCFTIQKLENTLQDLGMDETTANNVTVNTLQTFTNMPDNYLSEECRPGGDFDLGISTYYITPPEEHEVAVGLTPIVSPTPEE